MLKRLKDNFTGGIGRIKWFSSVFSDRLKIEVTIIKLLYQSDEMDKNREELLKTIGKRVYDMRGNPERNIFKDREIIEANEKIEKIDRSIDELRQKISDLSSVRI